VIRKVPANLRGQRSTCSEVAIDQIRFLLLDQLIEHDYLLASKCLNRRISELQLGVTIAKAETRLGASLTGSNSPVYQIILQ
jgi:hypothetical protein